jgi:hypothetical protein
MDRALTRLPLPSVDRVERAAAVLLLLLLGTYALGRLGRSVVPTLDTVGVIAVHLAVVVAGVFPLVVLAHGVDSRLRTGAKYPRPVEVGVATVSLASLGAAFLLSGSALGTTFVATAVGGLLVLAGLVAGRS